MEQYKKNESMEFIEMEDGQLVVFDPDSGDTHFIDEVGRDILDCLKEGGTLDDMVTALTAMYDAPAEEIRSDTAEFMDEMCAKKVVLAL